MYRCKKCKSKMTMIGTPGPDGMVLRCDTCKKYFVIVP